LQGPTLVDHVAGVITQFIAQPSLGRLRIAAQIAIQCPKVRGFLRHEVAHAGKILIGGDGEKPDEQTIKHGETGESEAHHVIGALLAMEPGMERPTNEKNRSQYRHHEHDGEQREIFNDG